MAAGRIYRLVVNGQPTDVTLGVADNFRARFIGLIGTNAPRIGQGLIIDPCAGIHTVGMRYPIDVAFLANDGTVLKVSTLVRPMRAVRCRGARQALELQTGLVQQLGLATGDVVRTLPVCHNRG